MLFDNLETYLNTVGPLLLNNGLNFFGAILILAIGVWFSGRARRWTLSMLARTPHIDPILYGFFGSVIRYLILTFTLLAVLAKFGVQTTSLVALLGAAGLAIGLALQGTLSNVAAGVMLLIFRPFRAGHSVEIGGITGIVRELTLFTTELATADNVQIFIPNSNVWGQPLKNFSHHTTRRADFIFRISYGDDIGKVLDIVRSAIEADARCHKTPTPVIAVQELSLSSVDITLQVWTKNVDLGQVRFDLNRRLKEELLAAGITLPANLRTNTAA